MSTYPITKSGMTHCNKPCVTSDQLKQSVLELLEQAAPSDHTPPWDTQRSTQVDPDKVQQLRQLYEERKPNKSLFD